MCFPSSILQAASLKASEAGDWIPVSIFSTHQLSPGPHGSLPPMAAERSSVRRISCICSSSGQRVPKTCRNPRRLGCVCLLMFISAACLSFFFFFFCLFRAAPTVYRGSQARGPIRTAAVRLRHSHRNPGSESHLRSLPQLTAMPSP